jgi:prepilin-type processing-associated H-X9-DG protein
MIKRALFCAVLSGWLMSAGLAQAHHSIAGVYDMKSEKVLTGTVAKVLFINPHGSLTITVANADGTSTDWVMTLGSVTALADKGIGRTGPNALHVGDKISVKCVPAKDGSPIGFLRTVTFADGHVIVISGENATS